MTASKEMFRCGYKACECEVEQEGEFCGPTCAAEDVGTVSIGCTCGHPGCVGLELGQQGPKLQPA